MLCTVPTDPRSVSTTGPLFRVGYGQPTAVRGEDADIQQVLAAHMTVLKVLPMH